MQLLSSEEGANARRVRIEVTGNYEEGLNSKLVAFARCSTDSSPWPELKGSYPEGEEHD